MSEYLEFVVSVRESGKEIGTFAVIQEDWMDSVDVAGKAQEALCYWASRNGLDVDDLDYDEEI